MTAKLFIPILIAASLACISAASAQGAHTQGPCSPVVGPARNITIIFNAGCTSEMTPADFEKIVERVVANRPIPPELLDRYETLSQRFGVTNEAVANFFRILGRAKVATEDLDATLREIAARHVRFEKQNEAISGDDPEVVALKKEAAAAARAGDYPNAERLLQRALDADVAGARAAQGTSNRRFLNAAKTKADQGELKLTELRYMAAAQAFEEAAALVPEGDQVVRTDYLWRAGAAAANAGNYPYATKVLGNALSIREKVLGADHLDLAVILDDLATIYRTQFRKAEAESLYRRALAIRQNVLGGDHPDVAQTLNGLAMLYGSQGRADEAQPLQERALAISEKARGPEHLDVAHDAIGLAMIYAIERRFDEAEALSKRGLAIRENVLGPEHPKVAEVLTSLAVMYQTQSRYDEAEALSKRALAIDEKVLGPEHPRVALTLNTLAMLSEAQGHYADAETLYKRALAIAEKVFSPEHPMVSVGLNSLAKLSGSQARYAEAEPLYKRLIAIREKAFGPEDTDVAVSLTDLASIYKAQGRNSEAESLYKRALAIREKALGPEHLDVVGTLNDLASLYGSQRRFRDAESLYRRVLGILEKMLGPEHATTRSVRENLDKIQKLRTASGERSHATPNAKRNPKKSHR
jgi:tetratricopeptide (TPR) repeat protein